MEEEQVLLSEEQVYNVLEFSKALYGIANNKFNYYTSDLANQELINLNNNPKVPTYRDIENALREYKNNAENLQDYSEFMNVWDSIYSKTVDYLSGILSFDLSMHCINIKDPKTEYKSQAYKDDKRRVYKFFNKFKYKSEFRKTVDNMLLTDTCFVWLRDSQGTYNDEAISLDNEDGYQVKKTQKFSLQIMPQKFCKITGSFPEGYLWDFDLNYFNTPNVNIDNYDPSLKVALNEKVKNGKMKSFIVNNIDLNKTNGFGMDGWTRTKVNSGAWCFKMNSSNYNTVPPLAHLMKSVFNNDVIFKLQLDKDIASAYSLLVGEMKTIEQKGTTQKDPFMINPKTLGQLLHLIQSGLKRNVRPIALPLEETKLMQFNDNNPNMADNQYRTSSANGVSASSMIYNTGKMAQFEQESALMVDYNYMAKLYGQFENFLNFFVNKKTKKYKFEFHLRGSNFPFERKYRIDNIEKLMTRGFVPNLSEIASSYGYGMQEFDAMLEESHYGGFIDLITMLPNANTMSSQVGRPQSETTDLKQSGATSRDYS